MSTERCAAETSVVGRNSLVIIGASVPKIALSHMWSLGLRARTIAASAAMVARTDRPNTKNAHQFVIPVVTAPQVARQGHRETMISVPVSG